MIASQPFDNSQVQKHKGTAVSVMLPVVESRYSIR